MTTNEQFKDLLERLEWLDRLAAVEHERWAHWQQYLHDQCIPQSDGSLVIPPDLVARWQRQIMTPFADLDPDEQESDREQVRHYLPVIAELLRE